jgi:hypothetical protein
MVRFRWGAALAVLLSLAAAACSDNSTSSTTTTPTAPTIQDTFSGTLNLNGAVTHTFTTLQAGQVTATLSTLVAPDMSTPPNVGLALGTWNGNACAIVISKDNANVSSSVIGTVSSAGTLCVRLYDIGNITTLVTYTINVNHP